MNREILNRSDKRSSAKSLGFTLIELLVVIAIIAILAAILFPVFAQAREKARQTGCISNNKQIGLGFMQYVQDFDEKFPASYVALTGAGSFTTAYDWTVAINPYVKNGKEVTETNAASGKSDTGYVGGVFSCPSAVNQNQQGQFIVRADVFPVWYDTDGSALSSANASGPSCQLSQIDSPSAKIAMFEAGATGDSENTQGLYWVEDSYAWYSNWFYQPGAFAPNDPTMGDCDLTDPADASGVHACNVLPRYRHTGNADMLYLDGHVKNMHKGTDFYVDNVFIPGLCETYWDTTCSTTP